MALTKTTENVDKTVLFKSEGGIEQRMTVANDEAGQAHIMKLLTDMYNKPIESTFREVVSNGIDAVRVQSSGEPTVRVTLPSTLSPTFVVEDNGVGMSAEFMLDEYSKYGASTKGDDFSQLGAFGLGAKSPLAYCNEFTVQSTKDGITSTIIISKRPEGNFIELSSKEETNEKSGTIVTIPVKRNDINEFLQTSELYSSAPLEGVNLYIDGKLTCGDSKYILLTDNFVLDEETNTTGRVWVVRDRITALLYNRAEIRFYLSGWIYSSPEQSWSRSQNEVLLVEIKPGIVNFSSSRDEITFNDRSKELVNKVKRNVGNFANLFIEKMKELPYSQVTNIIKSLEYSTSNDELVITSNVTDLDVNKIETVDGFSISKLMAKQKTKAFAAIRFVKEYGSTKLYIVPFNFARRYSNTVATMNSELEDALSTNSTTNIEKLMLTSLIQGKERFVIFTGVTGDNFKKFKTYRKQIFDDYSDVTFIFSPQSKSVISKNLQSILSELFSVEYVDIEKITDKKRIERSANRKKTTAAKKPVVQTLSGLVNYIDEKNELKSEYRELTVSELLEEEMYVVFARGNARVYHFPFLMQIAQENNKPANEIKVLFATERSTKAMRAASIESLASANVAYSADRWTKTFHTKAGELINAKTLGTSFDLYNSNDPYFKKEIDFIKSIMIAQPSTAYDLLRSISRNDIIIENLGLSKLKLVIENTDYSTNTTDKQTLFSKAEVKQLNELARNVEDYAIDFAYLCRIDDKTSLQELVYNEIVKSLTALVVDKLQ